MHGYHLLVSVESASHLPEGDTDVEMKREVVVYYMA